MLSHLLLVSLFINMLFEVKSITPKWSTNRFPTIAIDTSNSITAHSISLEIIKNNKAAQILGRLHCISLKGCLCINLTGTEWSYRTWLLLWLMTVNLTKLFLITNDIILQSCKKTQCVLRCNNNTACHCCFWYAW